MVKRTIRETGDLAKELRPDIYTPDLTAEEAAYKFLEDNIDAWDHIKDDPEQFLSSENGNSEEEIAEAENDGVDWKAVVNGIRSVTKAIPIVPDPSGLPGTPPKVSLDDFGVALSNAPSSAWGELVNTYEAFHPDNFMSTMESGAEFIGGGIRTAARGIGTQEGSILGEALGQQGGQMFGLGGHPESITAKKEDFTKSEQMFRAGSQYMLDKTLSVEEWKTDPVGNLLIVTGLASPASGALRLFGKPRLSQLLNAANPTLNAIKLGKKIAQVGTGLVGLAERTRWGVLSGRGGPAVLEAYKALKNADPEVRKVFYSYMREKDSLSNFHLMARTAVDNARETRAVQWAENYPNIKPMRSMDKIHDSIRLEVRKTLNSRLPAGSKVPENLRIPLDVDAINYRRLGLLDPKGEDIGLIKEWLKEVENPGMDLRDKGQISLDTVDALRRTTWHVIEHIPRAHKGTHSLMEVMYGKFATQLTEDVSGYKKLLDDWKAASNQIKDFEDALGMAGGTALEKSRIRKAQVTAIRNVISSLRDDPTSHVTKALIKELSDATGAPILPAAAGAMFSNLVGSGIISRNQLATLVGGTLTVAGASAVGLPALASAAVFIALQAPFVSPRIIGNVILPSLALPARQKDAFLKILKSVHEKVPEGWDTDTMTYYQVMQRLDEHFRVQAAEGTQFLSEEDREAALKEASDPATLNPVSEELPGGSIDLEGSIRSGLEELPELIEGRVDKGWVPGAIQSVAQGLR